MWIVGAYPHTYAEKLFMNFHLPPARTQAKPVRGLKLKLTPDADAFAARSIRVTLPRSSVSDKKARERPSSDDDV